MHRCRRTDSLVPQIHTRRGRSRIPDNQVPSRAVITAERPFSKSFGSLCVSQIVRNEGVAHPGEVNEAIHPVLLSVGKIMI